MDTTDNRTDDATMLLALLSHIQRQGTGDGDDEWALRHTPASRSDCRAQGCSYLTRVETANLGREFTGQSGSQ